MNDEPSNASAILANGGAGFGDVRSEIEALAASQRRLNLELGAAGQLGQQFGRSLSAAFVGLAVQGKSFGDVLSSLALNLSRLTLNAAFKPLESAFGSAFQSLLSAPAPISGGSLAMPEAFAAATMSRPVVAAAASSLPFSNAVATGSNAGPAIVLNISTPDADSFRRSETQVAAVLARAVGLGQRNL